MNKIQLISILIILFFANTKLVFASILITSEATPTAVVNKQYIYEFKSDYNGNLSTNWSVDTLPSWLYLQYEYSAVPKSFNVKSPPLSLISMAADDIGNVYGVHFEPPSFPIGVRQIFLYKYATDGEIIHLFDFDFNEYFDFSDGLIINPEQIKILLIESQLYIVYQAGWSEEGKKLKIGKYDLNTNMFNDFVTLGGYSAKAVTENQGDIYVVTDKGIKKISREGEITDIGSNIKDINLTTGLAFSEGELYLSGENGLSIYDDDSGELKTVSDLNDICSIKEEEKAVSDIKIKDTGDMYLSGIFGVMRLSADLKSCSSLFTDNTLLIALSANQQLFLLDSIDENNSIKLLQRISNYLAGIPTDDDRGIHKVKLMLDVGNEHIEQDFEIEVKYVAYPLTITGNNIIGEWTFEDREYGLKLELGNKQYIDEIFTFSSTGLPKWASIDKKGTVSGTPRNEDVTHEGIVENDPLSYTIHVSGDKGGEGELLVEYAVINVNDTPTISGSPIKLIVVGEKYDFKPIGNDIDKFDTLRYEIKNIPKWANFDVKTGTLSGTPNHSNVGTTDGIIISVHDEILDAELAPFSLTVYEKPKISGTPDKNIAEDTHYEFKPDVSADDKTVIQKISIDNKPSWATFDPETGVLSGTPSNQDVGTTQNIVITLYAKQYDVEYELSLEAFNLTVTNVNDTPSIQGTPKSRVFINQLYTFKPDANDSDIGDTLNFSINILPSWASFDEVTGILSGTPTEDDVDNMTANIIIKVTDKQGAHSSLAPFSLTVKRMITSSPLVSVFEDHLYTYMINHVDSDKNTFSLHTPTLPSWLKMINGQKTTSFLNKTKLKPLAFTSDHSGHFYIIYWHPDNDHYGLYKSSLDGELTLLKDLTANYPSDFTIDEMQNTDLLNTDLLIIGSDLYIAYEDAGKITKLDVNNMTNEAIYLDNLNLPREMAYAGGYLYFIETADENNNHLLKKYDLFDNKIAETKNLSVEKYGNLVSLDVNSNGDLYFFGLNGNTLTIEITSNTGEISEWVLKHATLKEIAQFDAVITNQGAVNFSFDNSLYRIDANINANSTFHSVSQSDTASEAFFQQLHVSAEGHVFVATAKDILRITNTTYLSGVPRNNDVGSHAVKILLINDGMQENQEFTIEVKNTNDGPYIYGNPEQQVFEDKVYSFVPSASDDDLAYGDVLTFNIENKPSWLDFNTNDGSLLGTPGNDDVGTTEHIVISVTDSSGLYSLLDAFDLTVTNVNDPPEVFGDPATTVNENNEYLFSPKVRDVDNNKFYFSITNKPIWANFDLDTGALRGIPTNENIGTTSGIVITVSDGEYSVNLAPFNITVIDFNNAPIAQSQVVQGVEDIPKSILLFGSDIDGDNLSFTIVSNPKNGNLSGRAPKLEYTPNHNFNGQDSFTFIVTDILGQKSTLATVKITITAVNDLPVVQDDYAQLNEDNKVKINVLANDTDSDGFIQKTSVMLDTNPANGTVSINTANGVITYNPNAHFNGSDSFTYTVIDNQGIKSKPATVKIDITAINDQPLANNDSITTVKNNSITIDLTVNDTDIEDLKPKGDMTITGYPANGSASLVDGKVLYVPNADYFGTDSFTYSVKDDDGLSSDIAKVIITVLDSNQTPVVVNDVAVTNEDTPVVIELVHSDLGIAFNPENMIISNQATSGQVKINTDATVTYSPNSDFYGTDSFSYIITDSEKSTFYDVLVSITINSVNDAPIAVDDTITDITKGTVYIINVLGNDTDVDSKLDNTSFDIVLTPHSGTAIVNPLGQIEYTPSVNFNGTDRLSYTIQDATGLISNEAFVDLTTEAFNEKPIANDDGPFMLNEDGQLSITVLKNDQDIDGTLDETKVTLVTKPTRGIVRVNLDGTVTYIADKDIIGNDSFTYIVSDNLGAKAVHPAKVNLVITAHNDRPVGEDQSVEVIEDTPVSILLFAADVDNDKLDFEIVSEPNNGSLIGQPPEIIYTPNNNFNGQDSFTFMANDGSLNSAIATVYLNVLAQNDQPIADSMSVTVMEDKPRQFKLNGRDSDGDSLSYQITSAPVNGTLSGQAPELQYTPNADFNGQDSFTFMANDGSLN
ncbi:Ig-like domain-containing protein, partial [Pseudoalteromonas sp. '520P1 No. 412']